MPVMGERLSSAMKADKRIGVEESDRHAREEDGGGWHEAGL